jgi:dipeptidyl-peptidase 4
VARWTLARASRRRHDPRMRLVHVGLVLFAATAGLVAQAGKRLGIRDLFALEYFMVFPFEEPKGWIDDDHYLVFDAGGSEANGPKAWFAVAAGSGDRQPLITAEALAKLGGTLAGRHEPDATKIAEQLGDADRFHWNKDHTAALAEAGNDLFVLTVAGATTELTNDPAPEEGSQFSPDGSRVAFVREHNLFVVPATGGKEQQLTTGGNKDLYYGRLDWVYQEEVFGRGNFQGYWWSPDGSQMALLELDESPVEDFTIVDCEPTLPKIEEEKFPLAGKANPRARLGVVPIAGGETKWFDLSRYGNQQLLIVRVNWTPDGKEVFFQVQEREQKWLDMLAGDPATGHVRLVFHEDSDCWVEPGAEPWFLHDGAEFLWLSERDGTRHVYRYARDGKLLARLTQGDWQVTEIEGVDEKNGTVWFTGDMESPLTTHLYSVPLAGGEVTAVTHGRGSDDVVMAPGDKRFLTTWSSVTVPQEISVCAIDGKAERRVATSRTQLMAPFHLVAPEFVEVPTRDGFQMEAMMIKPQNYEAGKHYPVLEFTYSGPHTPRVRDQWGSRDYLWHQMLSQRGFLIFVCDNRSASGKGRKYAKACWHQLGTSELQDLEDGVKWLVDQGLADPERVGIWGWSYGGYQTLFNLTHSRVWKCGIAVNPVTDWRNYDSIYTERYLGLPTTNAAGYASSSTVAAAGNLEGSLMLIASAMDDNVHIQNSLQFLKAMQEQGKDCDFMVYPGVRHGIEDLQQQLHLFARMTHFVETKL